MPSSRPIYPPPIINIRLGILLKFKASVEFIIDGCCLFKWFRICGFEPVAIIQFLKFKFIFLF